jgi:UPF0755 protein
MSELGLGLDEQPTGAGGRRDRPRRRISGGLAVLVAVALLAGGAYVAVTKGVEAISDRLGGPADYPGPGTGKVLVEVSKGDTGADIGNTLKGKGVVKSVSAFTSAFADNPDSTGIQVGFYELRTQMKASDAVAQMADPANLIQTSVTVPEGLRVVDVVAILAKKTDFTKKQFTRVLDSPAKIGLPAYAKGSAEGYLFPATYAFGPKATPTTMLKAMVGRWRQAAGDADLEGGAEKLGYTPAELMTIASLVQAEGRGDVMPKIARVIYNRLENPDNGVTNGYLQIDATVNFALDRSLVAVPTKEDTLVDSPYNTYANAGLPPGPIEAPGDEALQAALNPVDGNWLFYITVNLATGETKFTDSYDEFLQFKQELKDYCATKSDRC